MPLFTTVCKLITRILSEINCKRFFTHKFDIIIKEDTRKKNVIVCFFCFFFSLMTNKAVSKRTETFEKISKMSNYGFLIKELWLCLCYYCITCYCVFRNFTFVWRLVYRFSSRYPPLSFCIYIFLRHLFVLAKKTFIHINENYLCSLFCNPAYTLHFLQNLHFLQRLS